MSRGGDGGCHHHQKRRERSEFTKILVMKSEGEEGTERRGIRGNKAIHIDGGRLGPD